MSRKTLPGILTLLLLYPVASGAQEKTQDKSKAAPAVVEMKDISGFSSTGKSNGKIRMTGTAYVLDAPLRLEKLAAQNAKANDDKTFQVKYQAGTIAGHALFVKIDVPTRLTGQNVLDSKEVQKAVGQSLESLLGQIQKEQGAPDAYTCPGEWSCVRRCGKDCCEYHCD